MDISSIIKKVFYVVTSHLPTFLAQEFMGASWYNNNKHFKYPVGTVLDAHTRADGTPQFFGYGLKPFGWKVEEHTKNRFGGDAYVISTPDGDRQTHFKWNIEFQFRKRAQQSLTSGADMELKQK